MKYVLFLLILLPIFSFPQDTIKTDDIIIYKDGKIIQKEFSSSDNYIKIVYQYDQNGVLIRRWWYNKKDELIAVTLDD
jgi:hypothetical protein